MELPVARRPRRAARGWAGKGTEMAKEDEEEEMRRERR